MSLWLFSEMVVVFLIMAWLRREPLGRAGFEGWGQHQRLGSRWALVVAIALTGLTASGWASGVLSGWAQMALFPTLWEVLPSRWLTSFGLSLLTGIWVWVSLALLLGVLTDGWFRLACLSLGAPSAMAVGLSFLHISGIWGWGAIFKLSLALAALFGPILYRGWIDGAWLGLRSQVEVARVMGLSAWQRWRWILLPQLNPDLGRAAWLSCLWACGDFAVTNLLLHEEMTMAQTVHSLMGRYYLEVANFLILPMLASGLLAGWLVVNLLRVFGTKSKPFLRAL